MELLTQADSHVAVKSTDVLGCGQNGLKLQEVRSHCAMYRFIKFHPHSERIGALELIAEKYERSVRSFPYYTMVSELQKGAAGIRRCA